MENRLLANHPDGQYNARVNWDPVPGPDGVMLGFNVPNGFSTYAEGYKAAADELVAKMGDSRLYVSILVYPVLYCYRHYLELRLKEFVTTAGELLDQTLSRPNIHDLRTLWKSAKPLLGSIWPVHETDGQLDKVERVIEEFADLDPNSYTFRYPVDTKGNPSLTGVTYINVMQVRNLIASVADLLDGASYGIEEMLDSKREALAEGYREAMQYAEHERGE